MNKIPIRIFQFTRSKSMHFFRRKNMHVTRALVTLNTRSYHSGRQFHQPMTCLGAFSLVAIVKQLLNISNDDEEVEDVLVTMIKKGILAQIRGDFDAAEQILHVALKTAQERDDFKGTTYIFDVMANLAFECGEYEKAEKLFTEVIKRILADGTDPLSNEVIHISVKLAEIYAKSGQLDFAEQSYKFCLETQEQKMIDYDAEADAVGDTPLLYSLVLDSYAKYQQSNNKLKSAVEYEKKALDLCQKYNGSSHPQCLVLMNDVGSMLCDLDQFTEALPYVQQAVEQARLTDSDNLPTFLLNLGMLHLNMETNPQEAYRLCRESLALLTARRVENRAAADVDQIMQNVQECIERSRKGNEGYANKLLC